MKIRVFMQFATMALMTISALPLCASLPRTDNLSCQVAKLSAPAPSFAPSPSTFSTTNAFTHSSIHALLMSASNSTARLSFGYDVMDRLMAATNRLFVSPTSSFEFPVSYRRDAGGLVTNILNAAGKAVSRTYNCSQLKVY